MKNKNTIPVKTQQLKKTIKKPLDKALFWLITFLFAFWTVCSCLSIFNTVKANADSTQTYYTFNGSDVYLPTIAYFNLNEQSVNMPYATYFTMDLRVNFNYLRGEPNIDLSNTRILFNGYFDYDYSGGAYFIDEPNYSQTIYLTPEQTFYTADRIGSGAYVFGDSGIPINNLTISTLNDWETWNGFPFFFRCSLDLPYIYGSGSPVLQSYLVYIPLVVSTIDTYNQNPQNMYWNPYTYLATFNIYRIVEKKTNLDISNNYNYSGLSDCFSIGYFNDRTDNHYDRIWFSTIFNQSRHPFFTSTDLNFSQRTYYTQNYLDYLFDDETGLYELGYVAGLNGSQQDVFDNGYSQGFISGKNAGYNEGFAIGVAQSGDYSFTGLLGAVIDAPVKALTGLLDFEILGFNMAQFFFSLITLAIIIFVVKLIL